MFGPPGFTLHLHQQQPICSKGKKKEKGKENKTKGKEKINENKNIKIEASPKSLVYKSIQLLSSINPYTSHPSNIHISIHPFESPISI